MVKVKICGITNVADGRLALQLGADWLGFNFYQPSPRYIEPAAACDIMKQLAADDVAVGLFVNAGTEYIAKVLAQCPLKVVQLHGDEDRHACQEAAELGVKVWKALRIREPGDIEQAKAYDVDAILLDAFHAELYGGTGDSFDWGWIGETVKTKALLAGGINPDNVREALAVGTYGIDLCSGVEKAPGVKDAEKMKRLFEEIGTYGADK